VAAPRKALDEIRAALGRADLREAKARQIAVYISNAGEYRWAGIYEVGREEIAAIGWTGRDAPAFPRFPKSKGLCGAAVREGATVVVGDVTKDPRYLTTFGTTRSEIVVPIFSHADKVVVGLIDAESERVGAFCDADRIFLEECAALLAVLWE